MWLSSGALTHSSSPSLLSSLQQPQASTSPCLFNRRALERLGLHSSSGEASAILKRYDSDNSHRLKFDEFRNLVLDVMRFTEGQQVVPNAVRRAFMLFDKDQSGDIDASELRAALQSLGVPADTLEEASDLLSIYDASRNARLSLYEFSRLCDALGRHQSGSFEAIQPVLLQRDVAFLFQRHKRAIDELFALYADQGDPGSMLHYDGAVNLCLDFGLMRKRILNHDDIAISIARMHSLPTRSLPEPSALRPISRERFNELLFRIALMATERDPSLQGAEAHRRLATLFEVLMLGDPSALRHQVGGVRLLQLASEGSLEKMNELIRDGATINLKDSRGATPLHLAAMYGQTRAAMALISAGAPIHERTDDGWTPLHSAAEYGHHAVVSELLRKGANVDAATSRGWTPLHRAALDGHVEVRLREMPHLLAWMRLAGL